VIETHQHAGDFQRTVDYPFQVCSRLDGGSTFSLLSFALLGVAVLRRKLRW
jgi:hypothetical protein